MFEGKTIVILQLGKKLSPSLVLAVLTFKLSCENEFYEYDEYLFNLASRQRYLQKLLPVNCTFSISLPEN
jgi:hypothetical protein